MRRRSRTRVKLVASVAVSLLTTTLLAAAVPAVPAAATVSKRPPVQKERQLPNVPIHPVRHRSVRPSPGGPRGARHWPAPGSVKVSVTGSLAHAVRGTTPLVRAGTLPLSVGRSSARPAVAATPLQVTVADHTAALRAHVNGVLFTVGRAAASSVGVSLAMDYSSFADAGGANFGQRLHLVSLPACALTTPSVRACQRQSAITATNDAAHQQISTTLAAAAPSGRSPTPAGRPTQLNLAPSAGSMVVMAAVAGASGSNGTFAASSLAPSGSWSVSGSSGDFTWSDPVALPPVAAGSDVAPSVGLSYDSAAVDGQVSATNNQSSWVGEGWDYAPGYIERTYRACVDDSSLPAASQTGDLCWAGQIVSLRMAGHAGALVYDDSTHQWHPQHDDGSRVELIGAGSNGYQNEYWKITTPDGVAYYYGRDTLPGGSTTNATWTEPVYGAHSGDPCFDPAGFGQSSCTQAWRWNLDYVVDPHANATSYYYTAEKNYYGADNSTTGVAYTRGGYLNEIDYGLRERSGSIGTPADTVKFGVTERCVPSGTITCGPSQFTTANAAYWPDTPQDQQCTAGANCANHTPTFWSTKRLNNIKTYAGSTLVDSYTLNQSFPTDGDPELRLDSITRTGYAADGSSITLPTVSFSSQLMDNRVAGYNGQPAMAHRRLNQIRTETGEITSVAYQQAGRAPTACTASNVPSDPAQDASECFPVYWTPPYHTSPMLDYFHKYVATEVDQQDANATAPTRINTYTYLGTPAWHYDDNELVKPANRTYGQFRGYAQVETRTGNPNNVSNNVVDAWTLSTATYMRGMDADTLPGGQTRSVHVTDTVGDTVTDGSQYADTALEVRTFNGDAGPQLATHVTIPTTVATTATRARTGLSELTATMVRTTDERDYATLATGGTRYTKSAYSYDTFGRAVQQTSTGTGVAPVCTTTSYADNTSSWIRNLVSETIQSAQTCPTENSAPTPVLRDVRSFYDASHTQGTVSGAGDSTETDTATTGSGSNTQWAITQASYDTSGRPTATTMLSAAGDTRTTSISYTPADGGPLTKTITTNPLNQTSTVLLDPARGLATETADVAGHLTDASYDPLGRLTAIWRPGQVKGTNPASATYAYTYTPTAPLAVATKTLIDPGGSGSAGYVSAVSIYDAFGQPRQTQADAPGGGRVVTDSYTDSHAWVIATNNHWYTTGSPATTLIGTSQSGIEDSTQTSHDGTGRPLTATEYHGTTATWSTRTVYGGDRTTVIPPAGATETTTVTDARGQTSELDQWSSPPTITGNALSGGTANTTTYQNDPLGQQTQMVSAAGTPLAATFTTSYDLAGRVTGKNDPDTGTTTSSYDDAGELTATIDADGRTLAYTYDALGRKTGQYQGSISPANELAGWTYDTLQAGQLTSSTRYTSAGAYTIAATGYDAAGNPTGSTTGLPATETGFAASYTTRYTWTSTHLMSSQTPAAGGSLPTETINYTYDRYGEATASTGVNAYVSAASYSPYGEANQYSLGVNTQSAWLTYTRDPQTRRITGVNLSAQTAIPQLENTTYAYDLAGNPTHSTDTQGGGTGAPVQTQCYTYNTLDQLTQAWSATDNCATNPTTLGNNTKIGGPQPFWTSWSFDTAGGRTQQTKHAVVGAPGADTTTAYTNGTTTPTSHAHALAGTTTTGPGASTTTYQYDADGNTTHRTQPAGDQTLTYTPDNRIDTITTPSGTVTYTYDAADNQLIRHDPTNTTVYLPGEELTRNTTTGTITGTRYYTHNGTTVALRAAHTNSTYLYSDPHATNTTAVPTTQTGTATPIRRHYDPYGTPLGTTTGGTWPDQHAYLNKPTDTTTAIADIGARNYDPTLGRFLTVDPVLDPSSPQQFNGYSYANNNPATMSDPSGLDPAGPCSKWDNRRCTPSSPNYVDPSTPGSGWTPTAASSSIDLSKAILPGIANRQSLMRSFYTGMFLGGSNYWDPSESGNGYVCYGQQACHVAYSILADGGGIPAAKHAAAYYCIDSPAACAWDQALQETIGTTMGSLPILLALGAEGGLSPALAAEKAATSAFGRLEGAAADTAAGEAGVAFGPAPENAWSTFDRVSSKGSPLPGYKGGSTFANDGSQVLPRGNGVTYREWDVNPNVKGVDRGGERIVTGSDGTGYYTNDHYKTFTQFTGPGG